MDEEAAVTEATIPGVKVTVSRPSSARSRVADAAGDTEANGAAASPREAAPALPGELCRHPISLRHPRVKKVLQSKWAEILAGIRSRNMSERDLPFYTTQETTTAQLRRHDGVNDAVMQWWDRMTDPAGIYVHCDSYMDVNRKIYKSLIHNYNARIIDAVLQDEWACDAGGGDALDYSGFFESMFTLADIWCRTTNPDEYIAFLSNVLGKISYTVVGRDGEAMHLWRADEEIVCGARQPCDSPTTIDAAAASPADGRESARTDAYWSAIQDRYTEDHLRAITAPENASRGPDSRAGQGVAAAGDSAAVSGYAVSDRAAGMRPATAPVKSANAASATAKVPGLDLSRAEQQQADDMQRMVLARASSPASARALQRLSTPRTRCLPRVGPRHMPVGRHLAKCERPFTTSDFQRNTELTPRSRQLSSARSSTLASSRSAGSSARSRAWSQRSYASSPRTPGRSAQDALSRARSLDVSSTTRRERLQSYSNFPVLEEVILMRRAAEQPCWGIREPEQLSQAGQCILALIQHRQIPPAMLTSAGEHVDALHREVHAYLDERLPERLKGDLKQHLYCQAYQAWGEYVRPTSAWSESASQLGTTQHQWARSLLRSSSMSHRSAQAGQSQQRQQQQHNEDEEAEEMRRRPVSAPEARMRGRGQTGLQVRAENAAGPVLAVDSDAMDKWLMDRSHRAQALQERVAGRIQRIRQTTGDASVPPPRVLAVAERLATTGTVEARPATAAAAQAFRHQPRLDLNHVTGTGELVHESDRGYGHAAIPVDELLARIRVKDRYTELEKRGERVRPVHRHDVADEQSVYRIVQYLSAQEVEKRDEVAGLEASVTGQLGQQGAPQRSRRHVAMSGSQKQLETGLSSTMSLASVASRRQMRSAASSPLLTRHKVAAASSASMSLLPRAQLQHAVSTAGRFAGSTPRRPVRGGMSRASSKRGKMRASPSMPASDADHSMLSVAATSLSRRSLT